MHASSQTVYEPTREFITLHKLRFPNRVPVVTENLEISETFSKQFHETLKLVIEVEMMRKSKLGCKKKSVTHT